ncbi:N-formylglutamate amidohydrolase [Actinoplanes solisilvae]|uniref:N-formylglutamate amidohydrolase n=1 Tax=Actinoplanes solisilvae TaxID=2486853 RepID=UPI001F0C5589|nr:N-formylglutamate amidohydrolase [Actinoplanes solisilvae]
MFHIQPGDPGSPVILHVPHASRALGSTSFMIDSLDEELDHLTDAHTDVIASRAASAVRPWVFVNGLSRLVVDPERFPDAREEMLSVGMGAVYTHGYAGRRLRADDPVRDAALISSVFEPYAAAMTSLVAARLAAVGRAVVIDVHSYSTVALPYELHGAGERPQICLGTDAFHTPPSLLAPATRAFSSYSVAIDTPFAGAYVPLSYYGVEPAVTALMVEIRRDVYMTELGGAPHGGLDGVIAALGALVDGV